MAVPDLLERPRMAAATIMARAATAERRELVPSLRRLAAYLFPTISLDRARTLVSWLPPFWACGFSDQDLPPLIFLIIFFSRTIMIV